MILLIHCFEVHETQSLTTFTHFLQKSSVFDLFWIVQPCILFLFIIQPSLNNMWDQCINYKHKNKYVACTWKKSEKQAKYSLPLLVGMSESNQLFSRSHEAAVTAYTTYLTYLNYSQNIHSCKMCACFLSYNSLPMCCLFKFAFEIFYLLIVIVTWRGILALSKAFIGSSFWIIYM